jgi:hypothetical protein
VGLFGLQRTSRDASREAWAGLQDRFDLTTHTAPPAVCGEPPHHSIAPSFYRQRVVGGSPARGVGGVHSACRGCAGARENNLLPVVGRLGMATTTRQLTGRTHRIVAASIIEAHLDLDFGVKVLKRLHITNAPQVCRLDFERALHATIILCGGKRLFVELDTTQRDFDVQATVRVKRCHVPLR